MEPNILTLPMFPLNTVILPGETKVLHIFEDRYKELVVDCLKNSANFGIPYIANGELSLYGVEVKIKGIIKTHESGELDIEVVGVAPFKIIQYTKILKPKLYGAASIEEYEDDMTSTRYKMFRALKKYIKLAKQKEIPVETFTNAGTDVMLRIHELKREVLLTRRLIWPAREMILNMMRSDTVLINETNSIYLRDVHDHINRVTETVDQYRETLTNIMEVHLANNANKMNEVMKALTVISAIFIPVTFIAGVYGMNFKFMPEIDSRY